MTGSDGADLAASKPRVSDEAMLARFQSSTKRPPCSEMLGMRLTRVEQETMTIEMDFEARPEFANPTGAIQGGFIAAMLDEAMSTCAIIASNVTMNAPTLEMKVSFLRPLFSGKAQARAQILKWGQSVCFIEGSLYDPDGRLVARATATQAPKPFRKLTG
jgi:uncharacterized protein (TIGR00369 family)